jgi:oligopeptide transport system permease protein
MASSIRVSDSTDPGRALARKAINGPGPAPRDTTPSVGFWADVWRRLRKNRAAMIGLWITIFLIMAAIIGPFLSPYRYSDQDFDHLFEGPNRAHWFGTDELGRDVLTRVLYGARISLSIGFVASFFNVAIGVTYGAISGYAGGRVDNLMMRIVDVMYGVPLLLWVILLMVVLKPGLTNIYIALGTIYWLTMARLVRGQVLSLREREFVEAARALGVSTSRILLRHIIPNTMGPIVVTMTLSVPQAIFVEAFLSYIGLGVQAPMASWGSLASDATEVLRVAPHLVFFPGMAIVITMLAFNFLGDGLRDALDPRLRGTL